LSFDIFTLIASVLGEYHTTGKNQDSTPIELVGRWTAVDIRDDGTWKIRMLSVMRQPASARECGLDRSPNPIPLSAA